MLRKINISLLLFLFYSSFFVTSLPGSWLRKPLTYTLVACFLFLWYEISRWVHKRYGQWGSHILIGSLIVWSLNVLVSQLGDSSIFSPLGTIALISGGTALGMILAKSVQHPSELIPILITASVADIASAYSGPTKHFSEQLTQFYNGGPSDVVPFVDYFIVKMPLVFTGEELPLFGVTDWIFVSLIMAVIFKFFIAEKNVSSIGTTKFPKDAIPVLALFSAVMIAWFSDSFITGIPAITLLVLGILIPTIPEMRNITAQSVRYTLLFPLGVIIATVVKLYLTSPFAL